MNRRRIRVAKDKFSVGEHVRISKEKMKFAKGGQQTLSTEIFRITKEVEAATILIRAWSFKQDADRVTVLRGETHTDSHLERDRLQDK